METNLLYLEESGFTKLNLVDYSTPEGDCNDSGGLWDHPYPLQNLFQQFTNLLKTNPRLKAALNEEEVEKSSNFREVGQLLTQPSIVSLIDKFIASYGGESVTSQKKMKKSVAVSVEYRTRGNQDYGLGKLAQAAYYYTMAIVYAPNVPENGDGNVSNVPDALSLAYGNRSAVFSKLAQYDSCLADIEHALATGYPHAKYPKLLLRKVECLISLAKLGEAKRTLEQLCSIPGPKDTDEQALKIRLQLLEIDSKDLNPKVDTKSNSSNQMLPIINYLSRTGRFEPSTKLAPLSAKLETRATAKGNRLVAKHDISPGDILVVESPFVSVLNRKYEFHFCHHCCRRLEVKIGGPRELCISGSLVPCTDCTRVLYCSTDCRTESWRQYHQYECSILPVLYEMTNFGHLALRILLVTGLDVASSVINRNVGNEKVMNMPLFSDPTDVETNYEHVHRLRLPNFVPPPPELALFQLASAVMVRTLMTKCEFVRTDEEAQLAGTIMQRQFIQAYVKSHKISSRIATPENAAASILTGELVSSIGLGIYPYLASVWRHSCDPNTKHTYVHGTLLLYRATKCIPTGTEVTISLGTSFLEQNWAERQKFLLNQYFFRCDCVKCVVEGRDGLDGKYIPIGCKDCGSTLTRKSSTSTVFNCSSSSCSTIMSLSTVKQLYAQAETHVANVFRLCSPGIIYAHIANDRLVEAERHIEQLSSMKGMRNYCKLTALNCTLTSLLLISGCRNVAIIGHYYQRYDEIFELTSGITDTFCLSFMGRVNFYRHEAVVAARDGPSRYPRILKRAIELVRLFSLADAHDESTAPDLLVEESRHLWKAEQDLIKRLDDFQRYQ